MQSYRAYFQNGEDCSYPNYSWVKGSSTVFRRPQRDPRKILATLPAEQRHSEQVCEQLESMAEAQGIPSDGTTSSSDSKKDEVVLSNIPTGDNEISTDVVLHFNFWELLNLLQTEDDIAEVERLWWRADGARRRADRDQEDTEAADI